LSLRLSKDLPRLTTSGNRIVNARTGELVLLRGINLSGLEYCSPDGSGSLTKGRITPEVIAEIVEGWNANVIRVPFNADWALARNGYDPGPYRAALSSVLKIAAELGAYTILDLHWLDARTVRGSTGGRPNFVPPLPNADAVTVWAQLAEIWSDETAILYDLFNEPHDQLPDDLEPLLGVREDGSTFVLPGRRVGPDQWLPWARQLIAAIREKNPDSLIFVSGTDWGYDLQGCLLPDIPNLVYSSHVYAFKRTRWNEAFGSLSASAPVFVGEWGGTGDDLEWGRKLAGYLEKRGIGWTAWSWSDHPRLVEYSPEAPFTPTPFGELIRGLLRPEFAGA
jgi:aryl-phospho-beta-D-glucosidase BglC (GH1 family)